MKKAEAIVPPFKVRPSLVFSQQLELAAEA